MKKLIVLLGMVVILTACGTENEVSSDTEAASTAESSVAVDSEDTSEVAEESSKSIDVSSESIEENSESIEENSESIEEISESVEESTTKEVEKKTEYGLNEEWVVDGLWSLKITDVTTVDERNEYADTDPAQVVIITYDYENIGFESDIMDLYFSPERVIDGNGEMAQSYPASISTYAQETPVGAKMVGAQDAYGLNNESSTITVEFSQYDDDFNEYSATFVVPVN